MDIAGELLSIHRCLRALAFRKGNAVRDDSGRSGTVVGARLAISEKGTGNEFEVLWADGKTSWINGGLLTRAEGDGVWSIETTSSMEDVELTRRLVSAGELLGIDVLDHIVIGEREHVSFADRGMIPHRGRTLGSTVISPKEKR